MIPVSDAMGRKAVTGEPVDPQETRQRDGKGASPGPVPSGASARARDSVSPGRRPYKLSDDQLVSLPWDRLPILLSLAEAATRSRLSTWTLRQAIHGGQLPAIQIGRRLLVPTAELQAFLERGRTSVPAIPSRALTSR